MIGGFWFWLGIVCLSFNLGYFNTDIRWWWLVTVWSFAVLLYYFGDKLRISGLIIGISLACWGWREIGLVNQLRHQGLYEVKVSLHQDDIKWRAGYLSGVAYHNGNKVHIRGKCSEPPKILELTLLAKMKCTTIEANRNRYDFNPKTYWWTKGVVLTYELVGPVEWQTDKRMSLDNFVKSIHYTCVNWFETLPEGLRDYGQTLLLGYTRGDFYEDNPGIQTLGLVHLFSISGFQVTLCYQIWFMLARILRCYREDAQIGWFGMLGLIWLFAGGVQSLIRAVMASALSNYCQLMVRRLTPIDSWGIVLIVSLWFEPTVLHQLGGQLSFLLSFGLLWIGDSSFWQTNLLLNILIAPCLLAQTYVWQPIGILANLLIMPLFTYGVVPIVFIGVLSSSIHILWLANLCNDLITGVQTIIKWGDWLPGMINSGQPQLWWLISVLVLTGMLLIQPSLKRYVGLILMYALLYLGIGSANQPFLAFVDVKQGDAIIWRTEQKEVYMMDVGGQFRVGDHQKPFTHQKINTNKNGKSEDEKSEDINYMSKQVCTVLKGYGIKTIDHLLLSHQDVDHIGNFAGISQQVKIKNLYVPKGMIITKNYQRYISPFLMRDTTVHETLAGDFIGQRKYPVVHPFYPGKGQNEDSIAILVNLMGLRCLLTGDLDIAGEKTILQRMDLGIIDVLKCGHHGSKTSTSDELLATLQPKLGIFSSGKNNRFKHPHPVVVDRLDKRGIQHLNTADEGMIYYEHGKWHTTLSNNEFTIEF